ncbi:hypothetical protein GGH95_005835 [Coemansia sp. RSA 1836]|nr:hypothetical protein GGH95_005835 [Coemansia sp. RSA 1836]
MDISTFAPRIRDILQSSDLSTVSAKKVRRQLEHEMRVSLDAYKGDIDEIIKQQFQQIHTETQQRQQQQQQYAQQYAQQQGQMGAVYGVPQTMSGLHMPPGGGLVGTMHHAGLGGIPASAGGAATSAAGLLPGDPPRKRGRPRKPENEKKQQRKKRVVDPNKPKRSTGLSKPMKLSADLASFLGQKYAARTEVVKSLWKYIKEHDLQDSADKRYILCDEKLLVLFHESRLYMYTMNKLLNEHFIKPTPEENAEAIALLGLSPTHPAVADSASLLLPSSSTKAGKGEEEGGSAAHSPAPSDVSETQHTGDENEDDDDEDEDDDDVKSESQPAAAAAERKPSNAAAQSLSPSSISAGTAAPLTLPPMPSSINGASTSGGASGV